MGHTTTSQRLVAETVFRELNEFRRSLREDEQKAHDRLVARAMKHLGNISFACSYNTWALVLYSILLEKEKDEGHTHRRVSP